MAREYGEQVIVVAVTHAMDKMGYDKLYPDHYEELHLVFVCLPTGSGKSSIYSILP